VFEDTPTPPVTQCLWTLHRNEVSRVLENVKNWRGEEDFQRRSGNPINSRRRKFAPTDSQSRQQDRQADAQADRQADIQADRHTYR